MPCDSSHLQANSLEIEMSRVAAIIDELERHVPISRRAWDGYHERVYNKGLTRAEADAMTAHLCHLMQRRDPANCSLEAQIWWRDHQAADRARAQATLDITRTREEKAAALKKLTPHERRLLGLEGA